MENFEWSVEEGSLKVMRFVKRSGFVEKCSSNNSSTTVKRSKINRLLDITTSRILNFTFSKLIQQVDVAQIMW